MNRKTQLLLGFFATATLLSVLTFFDTFTGTRFRFSLPSVNQTAFLDGSQDDTDKDGLADTAESYWNTDFQDPDTDRDGFKDGEEVISGHDPTVPGPDDKLDMQDVPQNITQKVGGLILSGLTEGSLRKDSPAFENSVNQVVDDALLQYSVNAENVPPAVITSVIEDTDENIRAYGKAVFELFKVMPEDVMRGYERMVDSAKAIKTDGVPQYDAFFVNEHERLNNHIRELTSIPVPKLWVSRHNNMLNILRAAQSNYRLIRESDNTPDPMQGAIAISTLANNLFRDLIIAVGTFNSLFPKN